LIILGVIIGLLAGVLILTGLDPSWLSFSADNDQLARPAAPEIDSPAPEFTLPSLSGESISLKDYQGRAVLLNFWATWCLPCRAEMPLLQRYSDQSGDKLVILAINNLESREQVDAFAKELGLVLPVALDQDGAVANLYRVRGLPTSVFIDQDGKIRYHHIGILNEDQLVGYLTELGIQE
jgi:thiol-disulfide isomerase/thioredoxin